MNVGRPSTGGAAGAKAPAALAVRGFWRLVTVV
jgi:hypothetical protein